MNNYSPNMLKTFEECSEKFFLKYVQKVSLPQRSAIFEKGKKIHALANYYLNGADISKMEKVLSSEEKLTWEVLKSSNYFKLKVLNTEYNLSCKIDKYWIGGRLDALMSDDKGNYVILDYKTGNIPQNAQEDFQTIAYLLSADKYLKSKDGYNSLKFVYLGLKNDVEKEIELTQELEKHYEKKIISTCEKINLGVNGIKSNHQGNCPNCEYSKICGGEQQ